MNISSFKPAIVYTIYIASTPEQVWQALTSAEFSRKYFFGNAVEIDLRVGGAYIVRTADGALHISGEVIECDPPNRLTVTFNVNWPDLVEKLGVTLVTYEIEQAGDAVKLTLIQSQDRPTSDDILSGGRQGWPAILSSLKSVLETGHPLAIKMEPPQRMLEALRQTRNQDAVSRAEATNAIALIPSAPTSPGRWPCRNPSGRRISPSAPRSPCPCPSCRPHWSRRSQPRSRP